MLKITTVTENYKDEGTTRKVNKKKIKDTYCSDEFLAGQKDFYKLYVPLHSRNTNICSFINL